MQPLNTDMKQMLIDQYNEIRNAQENHQIKTGGQTFDIPAASDTNALYSFAHRVLVHALTQKDKSAQKANVSLDRLINLGTTAQMLCNDQVVNV